MASHRASGLSGTKRGRRKSFHPQAQPLEDRVLLANIFVTNTNDSGTGSLREALTNAGTADHILFQIPTAGNNYDSATGSWTIALQSALPAVFSPDIVIDGLSQQLQPGASTAHPAIAIRPAVTFAGAGLSLGGSGATVSGLAIGGFQGAGIAISGTGSLVTGDYVGTDVTGTQAVPNQGGGISIAFADGNTIGGTTAAARNVISGNEGDGITLLFDTIDSVSSDSNVIQGNYIGVAADGQTALANNGNGVSIHSGSFNTVGGSAAAEGNIIANNALYGVAVDAGEGNVILSNSIFGNGSGGIALTNNGNNSQPAPVLTQALIFADRTEITGTLVVKADTSYLVQFYSNTPASGQGRTLLGSQTIGAQAAAGTVNLAFTAGAVPAGSTITALASVTGTPVEPPDQEVGDTSMFSTAIVVVNPFIVTNTADSGLGSLRFAITTANADVNNDDTITFEIPTADPGYIAATQSWTILVASNLTINKPLSQGTQHVVVVDGLSQQTQPGATTAHPVIRLASGPGFAGNGLIIATSGNTVQGLVISGFASNGIVVFTTASNNLITRNYLGTDVLGSSAVPNTDAGVRLIGTANSLVNNLISGNRGEGVFMPGSGNTLLNNFIGTNAAGTAGLGNGLSGITVQRSSRNIIRGNVASGNGQDARGGSGIFLTEGSRENLLEANIVGTNALGTQAIPNTGDGIDVHDVDNTVGGTAAGAGNLVSGNLFQGIVIASPAARTIVQNNRIGTNAAGTAALGNAYNGVQMVNSPNNVLVGNLISGNGAPTTAGWGVRMLGAASQGNVIQRNLIGTDITGKKAVANLTDGVYISGSGNTVGGMVAGTGNVISGNGAHGLVLSATSGNAVLHNVLGLAVGGNTALPNALDGLYLEDASANTISGNLISGNGVGQQAAGINLTGAKTTGNLITSNLIGTNAAGTAALGNALHGIFLGGGASNNTVGPGNVISGNGIPDSQGVGVYVYGAGTTGNLITGNRIGTDPTGNVAMANSAIGVLIFDASGNTVQGNLVSGNRFVGVEIAGDAPAGTGGGASRIGTSEVASGNIVRGNLIGTNASGLAAVPNGFDGVFLNNAINNTVGGTVAGEGNLISGNGSVGIQLFGALSQGNVIQGNAIGLDIAGRPTLPNRQGGIFINTGQADVVGGTGAGEPNTGQASQLSITGKHQSRRALRRLATRHGRPQLPTRRFQRALTTAGHGTTSGTGRDNFRGS